MLNFLSKSLIDTFEIMAGQKVFFIGASKMCTSSIAAALEELGKSVAHSPRFGLYSHIEEYQDQYFSKYEYFLDGNLQNFDALEQWFPEAKFVLLDRKEENWLLSMYNWLNQIDSGNRSLKGEKYVRLFNKLIANKWMYIQIMTDMLLYRKRVLNHFSEKEKFLHLDIESESNEGWQRLSRFLQLPLKIKWENVQTQKTCPGWIHQVVAKAESVASDYQEDYPKLKEKTIRDWVFLKVMRSISIHFIKERHLGKNINEAFSTHGLFTGFFKSSVHVLRFFQMIACLVIRIVVNRERRLCAYLV